jgi:peptide/nickel transport system permease protein
MLGYIIKRLFLIVPTLIGVTFLVFLSVRLIPGDPATALAGELATPQLVETIRRQYGLDRPLLVQYGIFLGNLAQGDLGQSTRTRRPVTSELEARVGNTIQLALASLAVAALIGVTAGVLSATRRNTWLDHASMLIALFGVSMPVFWLGLMLMLIFAVRLGWFPAVGTGTWRHLVLPALALGAGSAAIIARMTRATMLDVMSKNYVLAARAKGVPERVLVVKHALRNALIPVVTIMGLQFGTLLGGAVITETVFGWPGIGRFLVDSILVRDYPSVQGTVLLIAVGFVLVNLLVDLMYGFLDPRIRYD